VHLLLFIVIPLAKNRRGHALVGKKKSTMLIRLTTKVVDGRSVTSPISTLQKQMIATRKKVDIIVFATKKPGLERVQRHTLHVYQPKNDN